MTHHTRAAFTLIELLIVMVVIAILAAMTLQVVNIMTNHAKVAKTRTILEAALLGVSSTAMSTNTNISPVPHPLANSAVLGVMSRGTFLRGVNTGSLVQGSPVDTSDEGLECDFPLVVSPSAQPRLLLPTDVFAGNSSFALGSNATNCPLLYGLDRQHCTILGSGWGLITYRRLPGLSPLYDPNNTGILQGAPYTNTSSPAYPDSSFLVTAPGDLSEPTQTLYEIDSRKVMDFALGPDVQTEISALGGIQTADVTNALSVPISENRLRLWPLANGMASFPSYNPLNVRFGSQVLDTTWKPYRLRGTALYDSWGHEVLFYTSANGSLSLMSAGLDGYFCWNPGRNNQYDTVPGATVASGDDSDATHDNIYAGAK